MIQRNRDLLVLFKQDLMSPQAIEYEVSQLHQMLFDVERLASFARAHELIDLNNYKVTNKEFKIRRHLQLKNAPPFVFLNNKN
jgi:hypothetical protein